MKQELQDCGVLSIQVTLPSDEDDDTDSLFGLSAWRSLHPRKGTHVLGPPRKACAQDTIRGFEDESSAPLRSHEA